MENNSYVTFMVSPDQRIQELEKQIQFILDVFARRDAAQRQAIEQYQQANQRMALQIAALESFSHAGAVQ